VAAAADSAVVVVPAAAVADAADTNLKSISINIHKDDPVNFGSSFFISPGQRVPDAWLDRPSLRFPGKIALTNRESFSYTAATKATSTFVNDFYRVEKPA
jgi:hypothetical protein